jgi:hypothetical protein
MIPLSPIPRPTVLAQPGVYSYSGTHDHGPLTGTDKDEISGLEQGVGKAAERVNEWMTEEVEKEKEKAKKGKGGGQ